MSTLPQWPTWTCPHCGEQWHSGREYCVTCKHGMVQTDAGQWVPIVSLSLAEAQHLVNRVENQAVDKATIAMTGSLPSEPASPAVAPVRAGDVIDMPELTQRITDAEHRQGAFTMGRSGEAIPTADAIPNLMGEVNRLHQEATLREDRLRRVEGELAAIQAYAKGRDDYAAALEHEHASFLQRAQMAEQRLAEYEEQAYLWAKPLLMALRDEGVPVSLDTVIPVTVERIQHPAMRHVNCAADRPDPATPDVLAMVAQLELRVQGLETMVQAPHVRFHEPLLTNSQIVNPERPFMQQHIQPQSNTTQATYPTWILTDAMQARLERELVQEQTLRGGPAYGGAAPRRTR